MAFRVIIAGGRTFNDYSLLKRYADYYLSKVTKDIIVLSGCAKGADRLGEKYAKERGHKIDYYPADWSLGKKAGFLRNRDMALNAQALIAFWDGESSGTAHMINLAKERGLIVKVVRY